MPNFQTAIENDSPTWSPHQGLLLNKLAVPPWLLSWAMELSCNAVNRDSGMSLQNHVISSVILLYPKITWSLNIMFYNHECPSPGCIFTWNCLTMTLLYPFRCHFSATKRFAFMQAYCMGADWVEKLHWSLGWIMFRFIITLTAG